MWFKKPTFLFFSKIFFVIVFRLFLVFFTTLNLRFAPNFFYFSLRIVSLALSLSALNFNIANALTKFFYVNVAATKDMIYWLMCNE